MDEQEITIDFNDLVVLVSVIFVASLPRSKIDIRKTVEMARTFLAEAYKINYELKQEGK